MICRRESGQVLLLATMSMAVLLGFSALAVDIGLLYSTRRRMQTAADAAAIAGATALRDRQNYTQAADDVTSFNGFTPNRMASILPIWLSPQTNVLAER
jgi:uncharacterized membrane protein